MQVGKLCYMRKTLLDMRRHVRSGCLPNWTATQEDEDFLLRASELLPPAKQSPERLSNGSWNGVAPPANSDLSCMKTHQFFCSCLTACSTLT